MTTYYVQQLIDRELTASGGEQRMQLLHQAFAQKDAFLLLDEPTTNLDLEHMQELQKKLTHHAAGFLLVTHDRNLLDNACEVIWELTPEAIIVFKGNYQDYLEQKNREQQEHAKAYQKYMTAQAHLQQAITQKAQQSEKIVKKPKHMTVTESKSFAAGKPFYGTKKQKMEKVGKALEKRLEQLEKVEQPKKEQEILMDIPYQEELAQRPIITALDFSLKIGAKELLKDTSFTIKGSEKVAIIGRNGVGKTCLLQTIVANNTENMRIAPRVKIGYFAQNLAILDEHKTVYQNIIETAIHNETTIRTVMHRLALDPKDLDILVSEISGGQKVKAALIKVFLSDMNVLVLDEPTNYLDIQAVEGLETLLLAYKGTCIIVSHDAALIAKVADRTLTIEGQKVIEATKRPIESVAKKKKGKAVEKTHKHSEQLLVLDMQIHAITGMLAYKPSEQKAQELEELIAQRAALLE